MTQPPLLKATGLTRRFGHHLALDGFELEMRRGEIVGLLGPNGAGKSTTLNLLSGCLSPDAGRIDIRGQSLQDQPQLRRHLGYLPEIPPLQPELRVEEFLRFAAGLRGLRGAAIDQGLNRALQFCDLESARRRLIGQLSKGYQQRVGLAQAMIHQPDILILDEPTVGLDPNQLRHIRENIRQLGREHAVIFSSHILAEIQALCDRVVIMNRGRIIHQHSLQDHAQALRLELAHYAGNGEELSALPGIAAAEAIDSHSGLWRLRLRDAQASDPREAIAQYAVEQQWGLRELSWDRPDLERLFAELTV